MRWRTAACTSTRTAGASAAWAIRTCAPLGERYAHHIPGVTGDPGYPYETVCDRERLWGEGLERVYKFVAMGAPYDPGFDRLCAELRDMNLSVSSASRRNVEFMPPGVDKGSAVRALCAAANVSPQQVMAFGDQTNDIPMLLASGWAWPWRMPRRP